MVHITQISQTINPREVNRIITLYQVRINHVVVGLAIDHQPPFSRVQTQY